MDNLAAMIALRMAVATFRALQTQTDVTVRVADRNKRLEKRTLTGTRLLLHRQDLEQLVLQVRTDERVDDIGLLDRRVYVQSGGRFSGTGDLLTADELSLFDCELVSPSFSWFEFTSLGCDSCRSCSSDRIPSGQNNRS